MIWYGICFAASLVLALGSLIVALFFYPRRDGSKRMVSPLQFFTFCIFGSVFLLLAPILFHDKELFGGEWNGFRRTLLTVRETMQVFLLEASFKDVVIKQAAVFLQETTVFRYAFTIYAAILYILSPILTAGFILSLFRNLSSEIRYFLARFRPHFVFSEINARSLALAESIRKRYEKERNDEKQERKARRTGMKSKKRRSGRPLFVFTDVFLQNEEEDYDLIVQARALGAVLLKKDVAELNLRYKKRCAVEIFLIGENESENIAQALKLIDHYKKRSRTKLYVFATTLGSRYVLDSANKGDLVVTGALKPMLEDEANRDLLIERGLGALLAKNGKESDVLDDGFKVRRLDDIGMLARRSLKNSGVLKIAAAMPPEKRRISILILGMGRYGRELLKTAAWFCRMEGVPIEVNIFDKRAENRKDGSGNVMERFRCEAPELIDEKYRYEENQDFSVRFFQGIDFFSGQFEDAFTGGEAAERLKRTTMAFVAFGDDDRNIEAAISLRSLFDRLHGGEPRNAASLAEELPRIYAIVYDDKKANNLRGEGLVNYKNTPYHIDVIGSLCDQYSYENLIDEATEFDALRYHISWLKLESVIRKKLRDEAKTPTLAPELREKLTADIEAVNRSRVGSAEKPFVDEDCTIINVNWLMKEIGSFERFEYFRQSSIAKAMHKKAVFEAFPEQLVCLSRLEADPKAQTPPGFSESEIFCNCRNCERMRRLEKVRWNAFMRSQGYRYHEVRSDRAFRHDCLVTYDDLSEYNKLKNQ